MSRDNETLLKDYDAATAENPITLDDGEVVALTNLLRERNKVKREYP